MNSPTGNSHGPPSRPCRPAKKKSKLLEKKSEKIGRISDLGFGGKGKFRSGYLMGSVVRGRSGDGGGGCGGDGSGEEAGFLHLCG